MENLYLILHKVRGGRAFDIATKLEPNGAYVAHGWKEEEVWIIPTSGHRAYPWWSMNMSLVSASIDPIVGIYGCMRTPPVPENPAWSKLPDHYSANEPRPQAAARRLPATTTEDFLL